MSEYPGCVSSLNVVCKHVRSVKTFYVNLDFMPVGVTALDATADTEDPDLSIDGVGILGTDMTVDSDGQCTGDELEADRAILVILSGGVPSDEEVIVTVNWTQSDGTVDSRECRVLVTGTAA